MLKVKLELFNYKKRGYKTGKEKQIQNTVVLTIIGLIIGIILTNLFPKILKIFRQVFK